MPLYKTLLLNFLDKTKWFGLRKIYYLSLIRIKKNKLMGSLIKKDLSKFIIEYYHGFEGQNIDFKKGQLGFGLLHYALIQNLKPKNILVIGSLKGYIPALIALACKENKCGHVDFVDAAYDNQSEGKNWCGIGFWKKIDPRKHFAQIGVEKYITTHLMLSKEFANKYPQNKYQYIYIDGDHSYQGVKLDYKLFYSKLERGGLMSFHDIVVTGKLSGGLYGVNKFWQELKNDKKISFPFPDNSGLGFIQK